MNFNKSGSVTKARSKKRKVVDEHYASQKVGNFTNPMLAENEYQMR
jgi:hypothetical protein